MKLPALFLVMTVFTCRICCGQEDTPPSAPTPESPGSCKICWTVSCRNLMSSITWRSLMVVHHGGGGLALRGSLIRKQTRK